MPSYSYLPHRNYMVKILPSIRYRLFPAGRAPLQWSETRTTDTHWRHKSKISKKLGRCSRQNMLWPYSPKNLGSGSEFSAVQWRLFPLWATVVRKVKECGMQPKWQQGDAKIGKNSKYTKTRYNTVKSSEITATMTLQIPMIGGYVWQLSSLSELVEKASLTFFR